MEKGLIVGVNINNQSFETEMIELKELCEACEIEILDEVTQNLQKENTKTYVGKGKIEEIKTAILAKDIDVVICNDELSPAQISALQEILDVLVFDRTYIILEIFKRRAKTREATLQVDIASLRYMMPRLSGLRSGFSRQRGAGGAAHGKGKGETQLEIDRRNIGDRISLLKRELNELITNRQVQRQSRKENNMKTVCLIGYTNSGKSTTLNALLQKSTDVKKEVMEKDMLFATLETATRKIKLENNRTFLITDTVGFVNKLPHQLVEAFKSTLEEIKEADLLLHVVDSSNEQYLTQIETTNNVIKELGVKDVPIIYVFNKIDKVKDYFYIPPTFDKAIRISAKTFEGIDDLTSLIQKELYKDCLNKTFVIPYTKGSIMNDLKENAEVINVEYNDFIIVNANVNEILYNRYKQYETKK